MASKGTKRIALVGFDPEKFGPEFPAGTKEKVITCVNNSVAELQSKGYELNVYYCDPYDFNSTAKFGIDLQKEPFDMVLIGAAVRLMPNFATYFESLVNLIHEYSPISTKLCFNNSPEEIVQSFERLL